MKIKSFVKQENKLVPIEVELSLMPGLPQIQFLGLPDQHIKESIHRIKSALRHQGFQFPKAQQVLVNLRPSYLKKNSKGLELAVALALLWETEQLPKPIATENLYAYGELTLTGEVKSPDDLRELWDFSKDVIFYTGTSADKIRLPFARRVATQLQDILSAEEIPAEKITTEIERPPEALNLYFSHAQARLLEIVGHGEHSLILAGPSGSGKSTVAKSLTSFVAEPSFDYLQEQNSFSSHQEILKWRHTIKPHHSITPSSMVGGGNELFSGEITRAHRGILILDELLEFHPKVQESLREPMEEAQIRITRRGQAALFPCQSLIVATTNLCPCGDYVPKSCISCRFSLRKCRSYAEKLTGPVVDRFQMMVFSHEWDRKDEVYGHDILNRVAKAQKFAKSEGHGSAVNAHLKIDMLEAHIDSFTLKELLPSFGSRRRYMSTLRVARTIADFDESREIKLVHLKEALQFTHRPFENLKRWD